MSKEGEKNRKELLVNEKAGDVPHFICERTTYQSERKSEIKSRNRKNWMRKEGEVLKRIDK